MSREIHRECKQYLDLVDKIVLVAESKNKTVQMMVLVPEKEKELYKEAAAMDDRRLSDWIRSLARNRVRELGLTLDPKEPKKSSSKKISA